MSHSEGQAVSHGGPPPTADRVLAAADELAAVARENVVSWMEVLERIDALRVHRAAGGTYTSLIEAVGGGPVVVTLLAGNYERLVSASARFRRVAVQVMVDEGMSQAGIAEMFGVSRQRVAALLADDMPAQPTAAANVG
jgi:hypothetical protein